MPKSAERRDCIIVRIEYLVNNMPSLTPSKPIIDKVDDHFRQVNEKAFEPHMVCIGPIHRGKVHLKSMEQHKVRYLRQLLHRRDRFSIEKCVLELRSLKEKARLCYPTSIELDENEFVEMLLLDGVFVIELIRYYWFDDLREKNDLIFQFDHTLSQIRHDLMLLENQLPFFVLNKLFDMTKMEDPEDDIYHLLLFFVEDMFPWPDVNSRSDVLQDADHLFGFVYQSHFSFSAKYFIENNGGKQSNIVHTFSASELKKTGVQLKGYKGISLWDISFVEGVLKLPPLNLSDKSESIFRNLIAYEQCFPNDHPKYVTKYAFLMQCLIRSTKDVEILRRNRIITNFLGGDDMICSMFSRLGKNVLIPSDYCYSNVFESVNRDYRLRRRRWMAKLKKKYFSNSPWAMMSAVGAVLLLILTFIQTMVCVFSYIKWSKMLSAA